MTLDDLFDRAHRTFDAIDRRATRTRTCRGCGCDDLHACPGGCSWVLLDIAMPTGICSACAEELEWHPGLMARMCREDIAQELVP